jgi:hypothetical protein
MRTDTAGAKEKNDYSSLAFQYVPSVRMEY